MKLDRQNLEQFNNELKESIKTLEQKYNVKLGQFKTTYTEADFTIKLNFVSMDQEATEAKEKTDNEFLGYLGAKFKVGFEFEYKGQKLKVLGLKNTRSKKNIILKDLINNKEYVGSTEFVNLFVKDVK